MSTISSTFSSLFNLSSVLTILRPVLVLGGVDLNLPLILGTNANAVKWGTTSAT
jgi:hypothetical protein